MIATREMLTDADIPFLFKLLDDPNTNPELGNRVVSLMFSPQLTRDRQHEIAKRLDQYYWKNKNKAPWQILRAVALVLSNRINDGNCILHFLHHIRKNETLIEDNLKMTDNYYEGGTATALEYYLANRINMHNIPSHGCVWEIFYVGRRAPVGDQDVIDVLGRRRMATHNREIRDLCKEALYRIDQRLQPATARTSSQDI